MLCNGVAPSIRLSLHSCSLFATSNGRQTAETATSSPARPSKRLSGCCRHGSQPNCVLPDLVMSAALANFPHRYNPVLHGSFDLSTNRSGNTDKWVELGWCLFLLVEVSRLSSPLKGRVEILSTFKEERKNSTRVEQCWLIVRVSEQIATHARYMRL